MVGDSQATEKAKNLCLIMKQFTKNLYLWELPAIQIFGGAVRDMLLDRPFNDVDICFVYKSDNDQICMNTEVRTILKKMKIVFDSTEVSFEAKDATDNTGSHFIEYKMHQEFARYWIATVTFQDTTFDISCCHTHLPHACFDINAGELVIKDFSSMEFQHTTLKARGMPVCTYLSSVLNQQASFTPATQSRIDKIFSKTTSISQKDKSFLIQLCRRIFKMRQRGFKLPDLSSRIEQKCLEDVFDGGKCPVCLDVFEPTDGVHLSQCCLAIFHGHCHQSRCPMCRSVHPNYMKFEAKELPLNPLEPSQEE